MVSKQQAKLLSGIHIDYFGLVRCLQPEQAFNKHKRKWVCSLSVERMASITVFTALDQLAEASHLLKQTVKSALPGNLLPPKDLDTYNLDFYQEAFGVLGPIPSGSSVPACGVRSARLGSPFQGPF